MRIASGLLVLSTACLLTACGDDAAGSGTPDSSTTIDGPGIDAGDPPPCGYNEAADATNHSSAGAEATMLSIADTTFVCGKLDADHFNANTQTIDVDAYSFSVASAMDLVVRAYGPGTSGLEEMTLQVVTSDGRDELALGIHVGAHAAARVHLEPGTYVVAASAYGQAAITAAIDYRIRFDLEPPMHCAKLSTGGYPEANDGEMNNGNDMIRYDEGANTPKTFTPSTADNPEPSGIVTTTSAPARVSGTAANVDPPDSYMDRDTFLFATDATTNELSVRVNWSSTAADIDFLVFPAASARSFAGGLATSPSEDEFQTFAVAPNSQYWLWIGAYDGATLPAMYEATVCAGRFAP